MPDDTVAAGVYLGLVIEENAELDGRVRLVGETVDASEFVEDALGEICELLTIIDEMNHDDMPRYLRQLAAVATATADQLDEWAGRPGGEDNAPF